MNQRQPSRLVVTAFLIWASIALYRVAVPEAQATSNHEQRQTKALESIARSLKECRR